MTSAAAQTSDAFDLKGEMSMWSVLRLFDANTEYIAQQLAAKVRQAPDFFKNMPVVIDLQELATGEQLPAFPDLVELMRSHGLAPIGIRNGNENQNSAAQMAGLILLRENRMRRPIDQIDSSENAKSETLTTPKENEPAPTPSNVRKSYLVDRPVRSGQQVYARDADLIVVAPVSVGAELMADGSIHVYGPLRGRALAGATGDETARIFCQSLEAELVAVAGRYQVSEEIQSELNKPTQIRLEGEQLIIASL